MMANAAAQGHGCQLEPLSGDLLVTAIIFPKQQTRHACHIRLGTRQMAGWPSGCTVAGGHDVKKKRRKRNKTSKRAERDKPCFRQR